jgi:hypothetical protein
MKFSTLSSLAAGCALLAAQSCASSDAPVSPYVIVTPAAQQPASPSLGTIVLVQQQGGAFVRIKTDGGTFTFSGDTAGAPGHTLLCIPAPANGSLFYFNVLPTSVECDLAVDLLGPTPDAGDDCAGTLLDSKRLPITTTHVNPSGGTGGTSSTSDAGNDAADAEGG